MPILPTRRRALWLGAGAVVVLVAAALAVLGYGAKAGWFDPGSVEGTTEGFVPSQAPQGTARADAWPEYGYDQERTRANPALDLAPPFRRTWSYDAKRLLEFPPVIGEGRVIVGNNAGRAMAVDVVTGRQLWKVVLRARVASSPALAGELVLFTSPRGDVIALRAATGEEVWRRRLRGAVESSPLVIGDSFYIGTLGGRVLKMAVATGEVRWVVDMPGEVKASLARSGTNVVVGDYAGRVSALRQSDGRVVWRRTSPGERFRGAGRFYAGPTVAYGRVYIGNINGRVLALSAATGAIAWVRVLDGFVYSSTAVADTTVYVGGYDHLLHALDAVTGRERWSFDAGERISGAPSVIGDVVYFSTLARNPEDGRTFALDARTGERLWTLRDGRYTPAVAVRGHLVITGVRTLYGFVPR